MIEMKGVGITGGYLKVQVGLGLLGGVNLSLSPGNIKPNFSHLAVFISQRHHFPKWPILLVMNYTTAL